MPDPRHIIRRRNGVLTTGTLFLVLLIILVAFSAMNLFYENRTVDTHGATQHSGKDTSGTPAAIATPTSRPTSPAVSVNPTTVRPSTSETTQLPEPTAALDQPVDTLVINEVSSVGLPKSSEGDWVELFNYGSRPIDLTGWHLTDRNGIPEKWPLPAVIIQPGQYLVIDQKKIGNMAPRMGVSALGEMLVLFDDSGRQVDFLVIGPLRPGISAGRTLSDHTNRAVLFTKPTPGAANSELFATGIAVAPIISGKNGLYHTEGFWINLSCASPQAKIHFTLDGSIPTSKSPLYTAPVWIDKNTVVSAIASADGLLDSECQTATFLFVKPHTVPVVCLTGNPSEMTDVFERGSRYYKPEYAVSVEYYEPDGRLGVSFSAGVTPKGRSSLESPQKSVTLKLRGAYGDPQVDYPFSLAVMS